MQRKAATPRAMRVLGSILLLGVTAPLTTAASSAASSSMSSTGSHRDSSYSYDYGDVDCQELYGIVSGGGDNLVDRDALNASIGGIEPYNPIIEPDTRTCATGIETPIALRAVLARETALFSVAQMFNEIQTAIDVFGDTETSNDRRRCQPTLGDDDENELFVLHRSTALLYANAYAVHLFYPDCDETIETRMNNNSLPMDYVYSNETTVDTPWGLAKAYVDEVIDFLNEKDGWNYDGSMSREYNRIPFEDYSYTDEFNNSWTPYVPINTPWEFTRGNRWQPLMEHDGYGYIETQEHVTPHIGSLARIFGFASEQDATDFINRTVEDPAYDHETSAYEVIAETLAAKTDADKLAAIEGFDDKSSSLLPLTNALHIDYAERFTTLGYYWINAAVALSVYDGVVLSWRQKLYHDKPRPPSIVKDLIGDEYVDYVETYGGNAYDISLKASEWEPIIRTMPHSEYPSASSCLCQLYAEQMADYTGTDEIDPPLVFPIITDYFLTFPSWTNVSDTCGQSRLWGGLHFEEAVAAGSDLCGGGETAKSIASTLDRLIEGDESAKIYDRDIGSLVVRVYEEEEEDDDEGGPPSNTTTTTTASTITTTATMSTSTTSAGA